MRNKKEEELSYFHRLLSLANIPVVPNSIQQPDPPEPDILCEVVDQGPLAVELLALDDNQTRLSWEIINFAPDAWDRALEKWPQSDMKIIRSISRDMYINVNTTQFRGTRNLIDFMSDLQTKLMHVASDFQGYLPEIPEVNIIRGSDISSGPTISPSSSGNWSLPLVDKIREKLTEKKYATEFPLELFAYATWNEIDSKVDSLQLIVECIRKNISGSKFSRVRVFDLFRDRVEYCYPLAV